MIKIIAGKYKGRNLSTPKTELTQPTKSMTRGGVFSSIQNDIVGKICLDLFAGSGSLGIEALSRGAKAVYFNDINPLAYKCICENLKNLNIDSSFVYNDDYKKILENCRDNGAIFDIIFLDPPYKNSCYCYVIDYLLANNMIANDAIIVCETDHDLDFNKYFDLFTIKRYVYGYSIVYIIRKRK